MRVRTLRVWAIAAVGLLLLLPAVVGCSDAARSANPPPEEKPDVSRPAASSEVAAQAETAAPPGAVGPAVRDVWYVSSVLGARVGHNRRTEWNVIQDGRKTVRIEAVDYLRIQRFGDQATPGSRVQSIETPDGQLVAFESEMLLGETPTRTSGRVIDGELLLVTSTLGKQQRTTIPWAADLGGPFADEQSLRREPMRPGEKRTVRFLAAAFAQTASLELSAKDTEPVDLPTGGQDLLRIDAKLRLADGTDVPMTLWCDAQGEIWKVRSPGEIEQLRATEAIALREKPNDVRDLGLEMLVKVARPLARPHETRRVRYRVHLAEGNPAEVFPSGASQRVKAIDAHTAEVTVFALRLGSVGNPDAPADPPTDDDRTPNNLIQSDYPKIVAMAREAAGDRTDPSSVAKALEAYVKRSMIRTDFSQAFATAAEVAETPVGDCTEHAVLLAALARARGIPARAAMGLVYMEQRQAFGYHMWTEVFVDGRWTGIDATLGRGGIGGAHLQLAHNSLKGASSYSSFLPVVEVLGQLKIEIVEAE